MSLASQFFQVPTRSHDNQRLNEEKNDINCRKYHQFIKLINNEHNSLGKLTENGTVNFICQPISMFLSQ